MARRPGGPARLRATSTSVRCPTTSRPSRIHDRRASSSRMPVASPTAPSRPRGLPEPPDRPAPPLGGSSTTRLMPARRASAATRARRSANPAARGEPPGRSMTRRSTARPESREPAIARPSCGSPGVTTTSHSSSMPRAAASTGSSAAARSSQATIAPAACASAARRRASVVRPLEASPRSATPIPRGTPPGPRIPSSSAKPVEKTRPGSSCGSATGDRSGTVASAPMTSPTAPSIDGPLGPGTLSAPGAAAPQRDRRVARAALRSGEGTVITGDYRTYVRLNQEPGGRVFRANLATRHRGAGGRMVDSGTGPRQASPPGRPVGM